MRAFGRCWCGIASSMGLGIVAIVLSSCNIMQPQAPTISLQQMITGLALPVAITHAGDGLGRLFITLQDGQILIYSGSRVLRMPFLDIRSLVACCGEQGLLSVAFHPNYKQNGYFYVNYTRKQNGDTVIARYRVSSDSNVADPNSAVILLVIPQPSSNHNGGQLQFGPDGYLYIGMGDGGSYGDPENNAQSGQTLLGKMLRIDVNNVNTGDDLLYDIPVNNPFITDLNVRDEIWALGLRNPWRFSFDRVTGDLFIGDVGESSREEVNFQSVSSPGGENYGWRHMEGRRCYNPGGNCHNGKLTLPILEYDHAAGCSITGGYRYRSPQIPQLYGIYLYGDYCSGRIWGATESNGKWITRELLDTELLISAFGEDESGELYVAHRDDAHGAIYRVVTENTAAEEVHVP